MTVTISPVVLRKVATNEAIDAELRDAIEQQQLFDWVLHWQPALYERLKALAAARVSPDNWPQSAHWNWVAKLNEIKDLLAHQTLCVVCEGMTQGLMRVDTVGKRCRLDSQKGLNLVYIDYLEVAPWNWDGPYFDPPRYRGIGTILLRAAIEIRLAEGFKGRIGLHSLPQSTTFYERCGLANRGPDAAYQSRLPYFEMTPEQVQAFLNRGSGK